MNAQAQWRLWIEYLLAKADGDKTTAAQKLIALTEGRDENQSGSERLHHHHGGATEPTWTAGQQPPRQARQDDQAAQGLATQR
jgi:hypothetical protein